MRWSTNRGFRVLIWPICIGLLISACSSQHAEIVYSTSFGGRADVHPWIGVPEDHWTGDPSGGGALQIAGGCVQPAASLCLVAVSSGEVILRARTRIVEGPSGASLHLINRTTTESVEVDIDASDWAWIQSAELSVSAGDSLRLDVVVGGIIPAAIQVDELTLELR